MPQRGRNFSYGLLGLLILLLAVRTFFWHLGRGSLNDWDEATYAQVAREMVVGGDWVTPHWNGFSFYDKPPLVIWLMAASMMTLKSVELAARLPSALAGLFAIGMTALLGRSLFCTGPVLPPLPCCSWVVTTCGSILCTSLARAC